MASFGIVVLLWIVGAVVGAGVGSWIAGQKEREPWEGALLGLFLGPIGWIIEAVLPSGSHLPPGVVGGVGTPRDWEKPVPRRVGSVGAAPSSAAPGARAANTPRPQKRCPQCAEDVMAEARICRYCRYEFPEPAPALPDDDLVEAPPALAWPDGDWITQPDWSPSDFFVVEQVADRSRLPAMLGGMLTPGTRLQILPREDGSWVQSERGAAGLVATSNGGVVWATASQHRDRVALATLDDQLLALLRRDG